MSEFAQITIHSKKERISYHRHPWVFSGAIASCSNHREEGELAELLSVKGERLGWGFYRSQGNLAVRMVQFGNHPLATDWLESALRRAWNRRIDLMNQGTNAYRVVNAEGDGLPGLVVDRYGEYLVLQIQTLGIEHLRERIIRELLSLARPLGIYEKSTGTARRSEGLPDRTACVAGEVPEEVWILEEGLPFLAPMREGQKSGLFLDQRAMRQRVRELSRDKRVLNCFCYMGGFSICAAIGGALWVEGIDSSARAVSWAHANAVKNGVASRCSHRVGDLFTFLRQEPSSTLSAFDLIILDPPALAKKRKEAPAASRGYYELHDLLFRKARAGTLLLTCSCTQVIDEDQFRKIIAEAGAHNGRNLQLLERERLTPDHPVSFYHPEGSYLKGFLLRIED